MPASNIEPYHDVQSLQHRHDSLGADAVLRTALGPGGRSRTRVFRGRRDDPAPLPIRKLLPLAARQVAISETRARTLIPVLGPVMHIRQLYLDAIAAADKVIYLENQYFTSQAVYQALRDRITDHTRPCPQIVLILPKRMHTLVEDISLSVDPGQDAAVALCAGGAARPHFGIYYTAAALKAAGSRQRPPIFIRRF